MRVGAVSADEWRHFAVVRDGGTVRSYQNGVLQDSSSIGSVYHNPGDTIIIGGQTGGRSINGFVDDFRITKGIARYSGNFTPPTIQMDLLDDPYASSVSLLMNME